MDVFEFQDYRTLIRAKIESLPKKGHGQLSQLARAMGVNATLVSQVFSGTKNLNEDHAYLAARFFEFTEAETLYLLLLVAKERAGNSHLRELLAKQISNQQRESKKIKNRIVLETEITFEEQAVFYSDWMYTAIHTLSSIPGFQTVDAISRHLGLPRERVARAIAWLIERGICKNKKGEIVNGPSKTFVDRDSPLALRHHHNWRLKAMQSMAQKNAQDFFFTAPFSASKSDYEKIRKELLMLIDGIAKRVDKSSPEVMATINLDLFCV